MNKRHLIIAAITVALIAALAITALIVSGNRAEKPTSVAELLDLGEKYLLDMDYEQAVVQFNRVIEIEPLNPRGYTGAAEAYLALGDTASAIAVLQKGAGLLPDDAEIAALLAELTRPEPTPTPEPTPDPTPAPTPRPAYAELFEIMEFGGYSWLILEVRDGKALLLSEYVLELRPYNGEWYEDTTMEEIATTWAESDLRAYLNGEFYNRFSESDRARIAETLNENKDNQWFYAEAMASGDDWWVQCAPRGGADTSDRIFLLSLDEVVRYFGDSGQLGNRPSGARGVIFDEYDDARVAYDADGNVRDWWLRSPGGYSFHAATANGGNLFVYGGGLDVLGRSVGNDYGGVRPALWLNL
ncbi:MAG: tetratricopeptide repeat protein [Lachnospiraceae bacterium]|jgi:tetratricopeptide (TPR) repeat protein|nr:tetratricopeptide repeat protein [Lachnospiraceae bacterium]